MLTTTLTGLRAHGACASGLKTLIQSLPTSHAENDPIALAHILDSNDLNHAIWALRTQDPTYAARFAAECVKAIPALTADADASFARGYADCVASATRASLCSDDSAAHAAATAARVASFAHGYAAAADSRATFVAAYDAAREKQKQIFLDLVN